VSGGFSVEGRPFKPGEEPQADFEMVSANYLRAMRIRLEAGRSFTGHDLADRRDVVIVNQAMARRFWPNESPIGKHIKVPLFRQGQPQEIVGVAADVRTYRLDSPSRLQIYIPYARFAQVSMAFVIRTPGDPNRIASAVRKEIRAVDKEQPVVTRTMDQIVYNSVADRRFTALIGGVFGLLALALAGIGTYGVVSFVTAQQTGEIGTRLALGATRWDVLHLVLRRGLGCAVAGMAVGIALALALSRSVTGFLYGVKPTDPLTLTAVCVLLSCVSVLASSVPAYRATRVNPLNALRYE
jgi:putative ABC transport system permease protein